MPTLADLQQKALLKSGTEDGEELGQEVLVRDVRSRVRPTEFIERKLSEALHRAVPPPSLAASRRNDQ